MPFCALFGHSDCPPDILNELCTQIENLYLDKGVTEFFVGYQGQFDSLARKALRTLHHVYPDIHCIVTLAYFPTPDRLPELYDGELTYYPEGIETVPPRFAIAHRNEWMVKHCDYVICYVTRNFGGAAKYVEKARKKRKTIINIAEIIKK